MQFWYHNDPNEFGICQNNLGKISLLPNINRTLLNSAIKRRTKDTVSAASFHGTVCRDGTDREYSQVKDEVSECELNE